MRNQGIGSWIARRAQRTPDRVAVIFKGDSWTYSELDRRVTRLAYALRGLGVRPGDRVAFIGPNLPAFPECFFAAGTLGAIFVPLNIRLAGPEIARQLADSGARALIYAPAQADVIPAVREAGLTLDVIALGEPGDGELSYDALLASADPDAEAIDEPVALDDPLLILYTSGTTGRAKGATLSHGNLTWNSVNVIVDTDFRSDEVALVVAPLFHTAALGMLSLPVLLKGGTLVLDDAFDPGRALELIARHKITTLFGVPAIYDFMSAHPSWPDADLSSVRTMLCGGSPVPAATTRTYTDRGLTFIQGYGMTETAPGALLLDAEHVPSKAGSAGVPHFFTDVRVVTGDLSPAGPGERGDILISGPNVMTGYWNLPEATAQAFTGDGAWFRSGDVGIADEDGYVFVADRIKDMIISGGENIYPAEVESALRDHPAVAECAVIGVPDGKWGEVGRAIVVLRPGASATGEELIGFLDGRIARYKIPKSVRFAGALPLSGTGKILKRQLRETYADSPSDTRRHK